MPRRGARDIRPDNVLLAAGSATVTEPELPLRVREVSSALLFRISLTGLFPNPDWLSERSRVLSGVRICAIATGESVLRCSYAFWFCRTVQRQRAGARRQIQHEVLRPDRGLHNQGALHLPFSRGCGHDPIVERRQPVVRQSRDVVGIAARHGAIASIMSPGIGVATSTAVSTSTTSAAVSSSAADLRRRPVAVSLPRFGRTRFQL